MLKKLPINYLKYRRIIFFLLTSCFDCFLFFFDCLFVKQRDNELKKEKKKKIFTLLFLADNPRLEMFRNAKWLKKMCNYTIIVACPSHSLPKQFPTQWVDKVIFFRNYWHLKRILLKIRNVQLVHSYGMYSKAARIVKENTQFPLIHSLKDVAVSYYGLNPPYWYFRKELPNEKYCLENADGIISESMEVQYAFKAYKIKKKPPTLFFPVYCDNEQFVTTNKDIKEDNIHLVYAGGIQSKLADKKHYGDVQMHNLIHILGEQKLYFHIYPHLAIPKAVFNEYRDIEKNNPFFFIHEPVPQEMLSLELSKYHFGIIPYFKNLNEVSINKFNNAITLKLFNFIEAGIPVIAAKDALLICWIIKRYNLGNSIIGIELPNLKNQILQQNYDNLVSELHNKRETISLKMNIDKLINFYNKIIYNDIFL